MEDNHVLVLNQLAVIAEAEIKVELDHIMHHHQQEVIVFQVTDKQIFKLIQKNM